MLGIEKQIVRNFKMKYIAILYITLLTASFVQAHETPLLPTIRGQYSMIDGHQLYKLCDHIDLNGYTPAAGNLILSNQCTAYIAGVLNWRDLLNARGYCVVGSGITLYGMALIVSKYLEKNPRKLHLNGADLIVWAIKERGICNTRK